jgi:phosphatidate cytidylyltransferase
MTLCPRVLPTSPAYPEATVTPAPRLQPRVFLKRLASWVALWVVAILCVYSGWQITSLLLIAAFGLAGQWEFYLAQQEKGHKVFKQSGLFCGALLFLTSWFFLIEKPSQARLLPFGVELVLALSILGAFIRLVVRTEKNPTPIATAALTVLGLMYVPFLFNFVAALAFMPGDPAVNRFLLIYLLAVTKFSDVGAYVIGSLIGRHKMIPRVSPGKTWEGFAGAMITSLLISMAMVHWMGERVHALSFTSSIVLGLLLPLISVLGDLAESVVKRDASIKDSGRTIPGIGGALDLIDSILFTAPVLYFYVEFTGVAG